MLQAHELVVKDYRRDYRYSRYMRPLSTGSNILIDLVWIALGSGALTDGLKHKSYHKHPRPSQSEMLGTQRTLSTLCFSN